METAHHNGLCNLLEGAGRGYSVARLCEVQNSIILLSRMSKVGLGLPLEGMCPPKLRDPRVTWSGSYRLATPCRYKRSASGEDALVPIVRHICSAT